MQDAQSLSTTPVIVDMLVVPVAGRDSMLLNLSGAHGPFFTRNIVMLKDNAGHTGLGEVPGGERILQTIEDARPFVMGQAVGTVNNILRKVRSEFGERDAGGSGLGRFCLSVTISAGTVSGGVPPRLSGLHPGGSPLAPRGGRNA